MQTKIVAHSAARLAVQFARERAGESLTLEEIAADAVAVASAGLRARRAIERQRSPEKAVRQIAEIARRYGARVVDQRDPEGMAVGLRFGSGAFSCGFSNTFFVA